MEQMMMMKKNADKQLMAGNHSQALKMYTNILKKLAKIYELNQHNDFIRIDSLIDDTHLEAKIFRKRSTTLLQMKQYYYAYQDAKHIVNIYSEWFKGYLQLANIESECGLLQDALKNYQLALYYLDLETNESKQAKYRQKITEIINYQLFRIQRENIYNYQLIWIGTAIGLVFGMGIVFIDFVQNPRNSWIENPLLKLLIIGCTSLLFYYLTTLQRKYSRKWKRKLLQKPMTASSSLNYNHHNHNNNIKSQNLINDNNTYDETNDFVKKND